MPYLKILPDTKYIFKIINYIIDMKKLSIISNKICDFLPKIT